MYTTRDLINGMVATFFVYSSPQPDTVKVVIDLGRCVHFDD